MSSKLYSFRTNEFEKNKAKGVNSIAVNHTDYLNCIESSDKIEKINYGIKSNNHDLYVYSQNKQALSFKDDKRFYEDNGIVSYPHGHQIKCPHCDLWINKKDELQGTHACSLNLLNLQNL